jgi:hypothetical protein
VANLRDDPGGGGGMNRSRAKGTAAESAVVKYLRDAGFPAAERRALAGSLDKGDVTGVPDWTLEIKNCARDGLPGWMDELAKEIVNAATRHGAVVHKRRGKGSAGEWFATMTLAQLTEIMRALAARGDVR